MITLIILLTLWVWFILGQELIVLDKPFKHVIANLFKVSLLLLLVGNLHSAFGQTQTICSNKAIPAGWIKISQQECYGCCGFYLKYTIAKIEGVPIGTTYPICADNPTKFDYV